MGLSPQSPPPILVMSLRNLLLYTCILSTLTIKVTPSKTVSTSSTSSTVVKNITLLQVQLIHRHGDRSPITPMKDVSYWQNSLPRDKILEQIGSGTRIIRHADQTKGSTHAAVGRGPFGQLTTLGLFQMVELGQKIREELVQDKKEDEIAPRTGWGVKLFTPQTPLHPCRIRVRSTDFPRTIQSVQALLVGLFPDGIPPSKMLSNEEEEEEKVIDVDVRNTNTLIPDPQPRNTQRQQELERTLAVRPHLVRKELEMSSLAKRATLALQQSRVLGEDALSASSGLSLGEANNTYHQEEEEEEEEDVEITPLPWAQLSEITKCLRVRDLLPADISHDDQEAISNHAAWRWFENMRHPEMSRLAMCGLVKDILSCMEEVIPVLQKDCANVEMQQDSTTAPLLHIYSAHDSTLIGLLCAFQLEQPPKWPEYGSYLKLELFAVEMDEDDNKGNMQHFVRFSLNGTHLRFCYDGNFNRKDNDDAGDHRDDDEDASSTPSLLDHMVPVHVLKSLLLSDADSDVALEEQ
eukprot:CAMPEP_0195509496 /NCGR_PEP_ID=MMETSP0794_2-20130614/2420_1 /TAXON_ID=515487 /ORGANISM="Stephanopyxis turris, Strain CCMP 815" /LENGTH=520 /DNA_ID=CAMNT_0040636729 /DNA_START=37 /DNA_END=1599 /DNA_ORIENTATION=+